MQRSRGWLVLTTLALAAWSVPAHATDATDAAAAQVLFEQGRALVERSQFAEACPKLAASQRLDPGIGTQLWLADCYENIGQTATAWVSFKEAAAAAAVQHDKRGAVALKRAMALENKLPRLMIVVSDVAARQGLDVWRDGVTVTRAAWGVPFPVDPGIHTIAASAVGRAPWSTDVEVPARPDTLRVTIPALQDAPAIVAQPIAPSPSEASATRSVRTVDGNDQRLMGAVLGGVGVLGIGAGTAFSFAAKSTYDASNQNGHCTSNNLCDAIGRQDRDQANQKALVATLAMGVGAAAAAAGAVVYFVAPRGDKSAMAVAAEVRGASLRLSLAW
jgi:hypothetical protein